MTKEDIKKSVLTGVVSGFTAAVTILVLLWTYIYVEDWYKDYKEKTKIERIASTPPDRRSGDYCPKCKSTDVGKFFYGYYRSGISESTDIAVKEKRLIPGGCSLTSRSPKYKCNSCSYTWGNYKN